MTNPYYNHATGQPISLSRGASSTIRAEYDLIAAAFTSASADIAARGLIAGQNWTGIHDFTGGSVKVPTLAYGSSGNYAVSWDALNAAIFTTVGLPGQTGNDYKFLQTVAGVPRWTQLTGLGGAAITGSVTLTVNSPSAMTVTPAGPGLYATLPDATTCAKGVAVFSLQNAGDYDYGVKDASGNVIGWLWPGSGVTIGLSDSSTAAGTWVAPNLQKIGITAQLAAPSISSTDSNIFTVAVDANRTMVFFGALYAALYDASTQTWLGPVLVRSGVTLASAALSGANQVLVASATGFSAEAVTITIGSGLTVNSGSKATWTLSALALSWGALTAVGASFVQTYIDATPNTIICALSVSGVAPAVGSPVTLAAGFQHLPAVYASGSIARVFGIDGSVAYAKPYTVSGTTLTLGTAASDADNGVAAMYRANLQGNGNVLVQHNNNPNVRISIFKLTGTVESVSSITLSGLNGTNSQSNDWVAITSSKSAICVADSVNSVLYANVITDTAGVPNAGAAYSVSGAVQNCAALQVVGTTARFALTSSSADTLQLVLDCSGASPSVIAQHVGNKQIAAPTKSAITTGQRSYMKLTAGAATYGISNASQYNGRYTASGVQMLPPGSFNFANGVPGAAANESWCLDRSQNIGGKTIKRIEACA